MTAYQAPWGSPVPDAPAAPAGTQFVDGRLRQVGLREQDRLCVLAIHLWWAALSVLGPAAIAVPIALWAIFKKSSPFIDDHGREAMNFAISQTIILTALTLSVIGLLAVPVVVVVDIIAVIRGAIAGGRGEYFRYPMTFRFF
jgi:uncharacterized Tic20 family protein